MPHIDSTEFGSITVDNIKYSQVLIVGDKVIEREYDKLKKLFNTSHKIGDWELSQILENDPEIILMGTGQNAMLVVDENVTKTIEDKGVELIIEKTPQAIITYNKNIESGKRVNALIHTTC